MQRHRLALVALVPALLFASACTTASDADTTERDEAGEVVEEGQVGVFRLREGDCVRLPASLRATDGDVDEVEDFVAVPCDEAHDGEVVLVDDEFFADLDEFPGNDESLMEATPACVEALDAYTGTDYESSIYDVLPLIPTSESWDAIDDRGLVCIGVTLDEAVGGVTDTTGSFRAAG